MLNVAVLGSGYIAVTHLNAYFKNRNTNVVGVFGLPDEQTKKTAEQFKCRAYYEFDQIFKDSDVDIVDICLPTFLHSKYLEETKKHNVHILCEKPMVLNLEEAERIEKLFADYNKKLMFAYAVRFQDPYQKVKEYIINNKYGSIRSVYLYRLSSMPPWGEWYKDENLSGGGVLDLHIHDVDYAYWILGLPNNISAVGNRIPGTNNWAQAFTIFEYSEGLHAVIEANQNLPESFPLTIGYRVNFDGASLIYGFEVPMGDSFKKDTIESLKVYPRGEKTFKDIELDNINPYEKEVFYFIDCVINNRPIGEGTLLDAVNGMKMVGLIKKSLKEKVL